MVITENSMRGLRPRTASNVLAQFASSACEQAGMAPREFLRTTGLTSQQLEAAGGRISREQLVAGQDLVYRSAFGALWDRFHARVELALAGFPNLMAVATNSPTAHAALCHLVEFRPIVCELDDMVLRRSGEAYDIEFRLEGRGRSACCAFLNLNVLAGVAGLYEPAGLRDVRIELTGEPFLPARRLKELAGCDIAFGAPGNRLTFSAPGADDPSGCHNPLLYKLFLERAVAERSGLWPERSFAARVANYLRGLLSTADAACSEGGLLASACEHFRVSRWTLHRHLEPDRLSFRAIVDLVRLEESRRHLAEGELAIWEISERLGFSSNSAFTHFFASRCNQTPSHFRRSCRG